MVCRAYNLAGAMILLTALAAGGCKALGSKPVGENVVASRQMSLRALEALEAGHTQQAEQLLAEAIRVCPVDERARCRYAELLWRRGEYHSAVGQMNEAIRLSAGDASLRVQLGRMHLEHGDFTKALAEAQRAIHADLRHPAAWALQGDAQRAAGSWTQALESYHRALSLEPHHPAVQLAIAEVYFALKQPQRSLAVLRAMEEGYGPQQVPPELLLREGMALKALGRHDDAVQCLAQAVERGADSAEAYFELASAQALAGNAIAAELSLAAAKQRQMQAGGVALEARLPGVPLPNSGAASLR